MIKRMPYGEEYLNWYYNEGGMQTTILGLDSVGGSAPSGDKFAKAIGPWDAPTSPYAYYFEPVFSAAVYMYAVQTSEVYKLLPKTTWLQMGDSIKYIEDNLAGLTGVTGASTPFASGSAESAPTVATIEDLSPAHVIDPWETSLPSRTKATWQAQPKLDPGFIKQYHAENLPNQLDNMLTVSVDSPSNNASVFNIESIDRICSGYDEASTTYCSAATDPDLWWGGAAAKIDQSGDSDYTFQGGAGGGLDLPSVAAARVLTLDMIDDAVAESMNYSKRKRYIAITGHKTINEMQKLIDPKQRYMDNPMDVQYAINGVNTRPGEKTGFTVASYVSNGIEIPFFGTRHAANETSDNRSATITDADIGNIYILDLDAIELREAIPITYLETPPSAMLTGDVMKTRHAFLCASQLFATSFRAHAAIKYLKST